MRPSAGAHTSPVTTKTLPTMPLPDHATAVYRSCTRTLQQLPPSALRDLAEEAVHLYATGWDYRLGSDREDAQNAQRFQDLIAQIRQAPARSAHEAAAKAMVVTLLHECDLPGEAQSLASGLMKDLLQAAQGGSARPFPRALHRCQKDER